MRCNARRMKGKIMREIIFRGKSIKNGDWVYGSLGIDVLYIDSLLATVIFNTKTIKDDKPQCFDDYYYGHNYVVVEPETVGQYTGLRDKNGTRIFEGDEYTTKRGNVRVVYYNDKEATFKARSHEFISYDDGDKDYYIDNPIHEPQRFQIVITGNIHDNKGNQ